MMSSDTRRIASTPARTVGARKRVAMLLWGAYFIGAWIVALLLVGQWIDGSPASTIFVDTLWWSVAAMVATILSIDRFIHVPAAEGGIWVVFSSAACFATLLVLFALIHSAYSRVAVAGSFLLITAWLFVGLRIHLRTLVLKLGVPEPDVLDLLTAARAALTVQVTHVRAELLPIREIDELTQLDGVVIDRYSHKSGELQRIITQLKLRGTRIYSADHIHELLTGRLALSHTEDSFLDDSSGRVIYSVLKRALDLAGATVLLVVLALPMLAIALALRLENRRSPALFLQERVGQGGRLFRMIKFRTMRPVPFVARTDDGVAHPERHDESRITPIGAFLRRYRLDELPQLINVLGGTMSLIGPRPEWIASASGFFNDIPHYPYRHLVRPGITGWAQVTQGHVTDLSDAMIKLELDLFYVKHMSFALDLVIGIRTIRTVLTGHGSR